MHVSAAGASNTDERTSSSSSLPQGGIRKCLKRMAPVEDTDAGGGFGLIDELLLHVFTNYLCMADLLRCAATCRRWRRLIASEAEFICRRDDRRVVTAANNLAVGFFHQARHESFRDYPTGTGRFLPAPSTWHAFLGVDMAALDNDGGHLFKNSTLVASRRGRLLLDLRGADAGAALRLAVVNLTTGAVFNLPSLAGNDVRPPERYACAFLTAADAPPAAGFRVILLYKRGKKSMACRSCSSDTSAWGPECTVSGANVSRSRLAEMADNAGVAVRGTVFWISGKVVVALRPDTLRATVESPNWYGMHDAGGFASLYPDRRLTVLPDGRLGAVQLGRRGGGGALVVNVFSRNDDDGKRRWVWEQAMDVELDPLLPPPPPFVAGGARMVRLGAVCEENGLVFFATMDGADWQGRKVAAYALDQEKKVQATLVRHAGHCCFSMPSCKLVAFMATTPVDYLKSLDA